MSQLRLGWRDDPDAYRSAVSYASSKPVREASEESPRTRQAHRGVQSRPTQEPPEAAGKDMGAGEAAFDGASPIPTHCHLWDPWRICGSFLYYACAVTFPKEASIKEFLLKNQAITSSFFSQKGEFHKLADAKIFLSDCLACDSCVSAEEGIQVSQQNAKDFFQVLNLNKVWPPGHSLAPEVGGRQGEALSLSWDLGSASWPWLVSPVIADPLRSLSLPIKPHPQSHSLTDVGSSCGWHHQPGSPSLGEASACLVMGWRGGRAAATLSLGLSQRLGPQSISSFLQTPVQMELPEVTQEDR